MIYLKLPLKACQCSAWGKQLACCHYPSTRARCFCVHARSGLVHPRISYPMCIQLRRQPRAALDAGAPWPDLEVMFDWACDICFVEDS